MNDIWQYLRSADRPIVMYGTGNGADKIFDVLDSLGIEVKIYLQATALLGIALFTEKR